MFLFAAVLFVLLTHLQLVGLLMIGGSLIAAVAMSVTRPGAERTSSSMNQGLVMVDDEEHTDCEDVVHEYPQAA